MFIFSFFGTILATILGASLSLVLKSENNKFLSFLQNITVGGIIALLFFELFPEAKENSSAVISNSLLASLLPILIGTGSGLLFFILHEITHKLADHHKHDENDEDDCHDHAHSTEIFKNNNLLVSSFIFLLAIFAHNIPEGLSLGISFLTTNSSNIPTEGLLMSVVLFIHNLQIGFMMFNSFKNAEKSAKFSFAMTLISSLPAYILSIIGFFISNIDLGEMFKCIILSFSFGSLFYVLVIELLPQIIKQYKTKYSFLYILIGILLSSIFIFMEWNMQIFGLVVASKREFETVFERIDKNSYKEIEKSPFKVFEVKIGNKKVYTILSGVGEILAAAATQHLIDKYNVTFIFNYGVVGSLVDEIDLNNTVIVEKIVDYEFDTTPIDDSKVGEHLGLINDQYLRVNSEILSLVKNIRPDLKLVTCASGNKFVATIEDREYLHKTFQAEICEMEAAGIYITSYANNVPAIFIKGVSDTKTGGAEEFTNMIKESSAVAFEILVDIISRF